VARKIGADPAFVIAATHGKRAIDTIAHFKPHLRAHDLPAAVDEFERSITFYADAHTRGGGQRYADYALALVRRRLQLRTQLDCGQLMRVVASAERSSLSSLGHVRSSRTSSRRL
jgi:hypothetical protein